MDVEAGLSSSFSRAALLNLLKKDRSIDSRGLLVMRSLHERGIDGPRERLDTRFSMNSPRDSDAHQSKPSSTQTTGRFSDSDC